jgi:hypothetical protein
MLMKNKFSEFIGSITGVSSITALCLLAAKKYDAAAMLFAVVSVGAAGILWERYSRKAQAPLNFKAFSKRRMLDGDELQFLIAHSPHVILAAASYFLAKQKAAKENSYGTFRL